MKSHSIDPAGQISTTKYQKAIEINANPKHNVNRKVDINQRTTKAQEEEIIKTTKQRFKSKRSEKLNTFKIPNIVHYIWYNNKSRDLTFENVLSITSAYKILNPEVIYFHTNNVPHGKHWDEVKEFVKINKREPSRELLGQKVKLPIYDTSDSDVDRLRMLVKYGGIYLDLDVLVIQRLDELRKYDCVIGLEFYTTVSGGVILASQNSEFIQKWLRTYAYDYKVSQWAYNSGKVPYKLSRRFPHLCHLEVDRINRPSWFELGKFLDTRAKFKHLWHRNYVLHTWSRIWYQSERFNSTIITERSIRTMDNAYGQIARTIYFGSSKILT